MNLRKFFYNLGERFRNPSIRSQLEFLKKSDHWTLEQLEKHQEEAFLDLVRFSIEHSPYYQKVFTKHGLSKDSFQSIEDIKKIPFLKKSDLMDFNKEIHCDFKFKKLYKATTSGSSGESLEYYRNEESDSFSRAIIQRGYSWYSIHPSDFNGYFWGFNFSWFQKLSTFFFDYVQNRIRLFSYNINDLKRFVNRIEKAKYLHGYSSMIYETARLINKYDLQPPKGIKLLKGTSEKIFPYYHEETKKAFGLPIVSEYGATESGVIAFECPVGNMHIAMEGVYVEEVDKEIIVTNLHLKSFPVLRYKLGDYIELAPKEFRCNCGRKHRVIKEVNGRVGKKIKGKKEQYPSLFLYYIFKNLSKDKKIYLNYQVIQKVSSKLEFYIRQELDSTERKYLEKEIVKHFPEEDISFTIKDGYSDFRRDGKLKDFISEL